jgi:hypothetical protein
MNLRVGEVADIIGDKEGLMILSLELVFALSMKLAS